MDSGLFAEWQSQSLSYLVNLLMVHTIPMWTVLKEGKTALSVRSANRSRNLRAVKEDIEGGYLQKIRSLLEAEVFSDFLDMAQHLHDTGYRPPSAFLAGAVLEDGLRKIAEAHTIQLKPKETISSLNDKCRDVVYNQLVWRKIQVWGDIRNKADHGKFDQYLEDDVSAMIDGVQSFLAEHLK